MFGDGISANRVKVKAVKDFPQPTVLKQTRSFLRLTSYYRRFIPSFSKVATPLYALTKKDAPFEWTSSYEEAFGQLKVLPDYIMLCNIHCNLHVCVIVVLFVLNNVIVIHVQCRVGCIHACSVKIPLTHSLTHSHIHSSLKSP